MPVSFSFSCTDWAGRIHSKKTTSEVLRSTTLVPTNTTTTFPFLSWAIVNALSRNSISMRKNVECTFGILKGRSRVHKAVIPLHGIEVFDKVWNRCCASHNFLLEEDNLSERWDVNRYMQSDGYHTMMRIL